MSDAGASPIGRLHAAYRTHPGLVRANNEDVAFVNSDRGVFGVIDGVGGHAAGEVAAAIAHDVIVQRLNRPLGTPAERVREAIAIANNEIFRRAQESRAHRGMTCVVTLALVTDRRLTIGHVGDSRLYKLRTDGMRKLTRDHSPVGEREDALELTEGEAMRHPRRNEVFRDVGSAHRDKDEDEFVDVIEEPFERDAAILLCTDGLTDMVSSAAIEQIVRQHAGGPADVVDALIAAANDAGGKDNVTVVYAEAPEFARAFNRRRATPRQPGTAADRGSPPRDPQRAAAGTAALPADAPRTGRAVLFRRWVVRSRTTWFALGALAGVLGALALLWRISGASVDRGRTLVVGGAGAHTFSRIADAVSTARAGDVIRLEPGVYAEQVIVPEGVDLVARVSGTVTLARAADVRGEWVGVTALGDATGRIVGIRVESTAERPIDVGMRVSGHGRTIEVVDVGGVMRAGIELLPASTVQIQGSLLAVPGPALSMADGSAATLISNVFLRIGRSVEPPIARAGAAETTVVLRRNVFAGYGADVMKGLSGDERRQMLADNFVFASEPPIGRR